MNRQESVSPVNAEGASTKPSTPRMVKWALMLVCMLLIFAILYNILKPECFVYYIGFNVETFTAVTPGNISQHTSKQKISAEDFISLKNFLLSAAGNKGSLTEARTRLVAYCRGQGEIVIDADGKVRINKREWQLGKRDLKRVAYMVVGAIEGEKE